MLEKISALIQGCSIIIASITAIYGVTLWRREAKWKRKYEIAEEVLTCVYEISDRFEEIRSPASYTGEGLSRKKGEKETEEQSKILDIAYVTIERYEKDKSAFIKLASLKYRFMVLFGKGASKPIEDIFILKNRLLYASRRLGERYWIEQGRKSFSEKEFEKHLIKMEEFEAVIYSDNDENDQFKKTMNDAINHIEEVCQQIIENNKFKKTDKIFHTSKSK